MISIQGDDMTTLMQEVKIFEGYAEALDTLARETCALMGGSYEALCDVPSTLKVDTSAIAGVICDIQSINARLSLGTNLMGN